MRNRILLAWLAAVPAAAACAGADARQATTPEYPVRAVPLERVAVTGGFWQTRLETNRTVTIPHILDQNEATGRVDNFRRGAGLLDGAYEGRRFNDTDIYKIIEAASYSLAVHPDPALAARVDALIDLIARSQEPDGYLFPARTVDPANPAPGAGPDRWIHLNTGSHELYNAGHLYEAAVAHAAATGSRALLDVAVRNADLVDETFGPDARVDAPGHEEIELALVRLARATGDRRYLDLARFFVDVRGTDHDASVDYTDESWQLYNDRAYRQDDRPVVEQTRGQGHAVRATYLYSAMTDLAALLESPAYGRAVETIWQDVYSRRAYLTGGLGSVSGTEAFGDDYVLPSRSAYTETCASIGGILWNYRMFLRSADARYLDAFEQTLYNGFLSGVSIAGDTFFYQNPLEATGRGRSGGRTPYFEVACCPANLARLIAQLPGLIYAQRGDELFVNLYVGSAVRTTLGGGDVRLTQTTEYPWQGRVAFEVEPASPMRFALKLRRPGWLGDGPFGTALYRFETPVDAPVELRVNGEPIEPATEGGWLIVAREWSPGDRVELALPMPVRRVAGHSQLEAAGGRTAIQRGPVVYAFEGADNGGAVLDAMLPADAELGAEFRPDLLGGLMTVSATVPSAEGGPRELIAVPYFAWANRARGEMVVWIRR